MHGFTRISGLRLAAAAILTATGSLASLPARAQDSTANSMIYLCTTSAAVQVDKKGNETASQGYYKIVRGVRPADADALLAAWQEFIKPISRNPGVCEGWTPREEFEVIQAVANRRNGGEAMNEVGFVFKPRAASIASELLRATVPFRDPDPARRERGFSGLVFDVEYRFVACQGELQIAYRVVADSARAAPGSRTAPSYLFDGEYGKPDSLPTIVPDVPLSGTVRGRSSKTVGTFADSHAGPVPDLGCFSSQNQRLAALDAVVGPDAGDAEIEAFLDTLVAEIETDEVYISAGAEADIRAQARIESNSSVARRLIQSQPEAAQPAPIAGPPPAVAEAARPAPPTPEEPAGLTERQKYFAGQYDRNLAETEARDAQNAAAQQSYAEQQAAYEAELERARKAREAYLKSLGTAAAPTTTP